MAIVEPTLPSFILTGSLTTDGIDSAWTYSDGVHADGDMFVGGIHRIAVTIAVNPRTHSSPLVTHPFSGSREFNGLDVEVGDWVSNATGGRAMQIVDLQAQSDTTVRAVLEDVGRYNTFQDPSQSGTAFLTDGPVILFRVDDNLEPVLDNLDPSIIPDILKDAYWATNIVQRFATWREQLGLYTQSVSHGCSRGQLLKVATATDVTPTVLRGSVASPNVTEGENARINSTTFTFPALATAASIVAFLNSLNLDNGAITASLEGGRVTLTAADGRDIVVADLNFGSSLSMGLGLGNGRGVAVGKLIPVTSDQDDAVAVVTALGPDPDHFYFRWLGRVVGLTQYVPGAVGQTLFASPSGTYTTNPVEGGHSIAIRYRTPQATVLKGRANATTPPGSDFVLNGVYVMIGGAGTVDDAVAAITAAAVPNITASNDGGALRIEHTAGSKIVIWSGITGDAARDLGLNAFTPANDRTKLVVLDRPAVPKAKVVYPTSLVGSDAAATVPADTPLAFYVDGVDHTLTLPDLDGSGAVEVADVVAAINAEPVFRAAEILAGTDAAGKLVIQSMTGATLQVANGLTGSAAESFFGVPSLKSERVRANGYFLTVTNATGTAIPRAKLVKLASATNGDIRVAPVTAATDTPLGVTVRAIPANGSGRVVVQGLLSTPLATTGAAVGDPVFFTASGDLTLTAGGPRVGLVAEVGATAEVYLTLAGGGSGGGLSAVVEDPAPKLGGDLDVTGRQLYSTGADDIVLNARGFGAVVVVSNNEPAITGSDGFDLTVKAGAATPSEAAGDLVLRGGQGDATHSDGVVRIQDPLGGPIASFHGDRTAVNGLEFHAAPTGQAVEIAAKGTDTNASLLLSPQNDGQILAPASYEPAVGNALVTKDYVDYMSANSGTVPPLSDKTLAVTGDLVRLASGVTQNFTGSGPAAGSEIVRVTAAAVTTQTVVAFGDGKAGTLTATLNGTSVGSKTLTTGSDVGLVSGLEITADRAYPATSSVSRALDARVKVTVPAGVNRVALLHSVTGSVTATFVCDTDTAVPTVSAVTLSQSGTTTVKSSGVPHLKTGAVAAAIQVAKLATATYLPDNVITVQAEPAVFPAVGYKPGQAGLPAVLVTGTTYLTSGVTLTPAGDHHTQARVKVSAQNPNGVSPTVTAPLVLNLMTGGPVPAADGSGGLQETNVFCDPTLGRTPADAVSQAVRIALSAGDTPDDDLTALLASDWDSTALLWTHEAAVVGGVARADLTDYGTGYLPVGPTLATGTAVQYLSFFLRRSAVSRFRIVLAAGSRVSGCWVKLVGIDTTTAANGWLDMFAPYRGFGAPGDNPAAGGNGENGCAFGRAMDGTAGAFVATFGRQNSTNATNNTILVRFRLAAGDQITGLAFTSV